MGIPGDAGRGRGSMDRMRYLPVDGAAGRRVSSGHVVVSHALRADEPAYRRWLTPVIREVA